jgi:dihydrofolate reductase
MISIIVAMTKSRVIGKDNGIPWRLPEDMKHFKSTTMGHPVIMGTNTYESIGRPLPGRRNIVLSRRKDLQIPGCEVMTLLDALCVDGDPFVIGGAEVYSWTLQFAKRIYLTEVEDEYEGDAYFPEFDMNDWVEASRRDGTGCVFRVLERRAE